MFTKSVYKTREAIQYVRNPFIPVGEMERSLKESDYKDVSHLTDNEKTNLAVYDSRWKKVIEARAEMEVELLDAQASWGKAILLEQEDFDGLIRKVNATVTLFLRDKWKEGQDEILYNTGKENSFNKELDIAIEKIEKYLKPYLS